MDSLPDASRGKQKLAAALDAFALSPAGRVCADLGSHAGGFVACLLERGAARVYSVERGFGVLDYALRRDPRVVVMERTDALQVHLPEPVDLVTIDVGWTRQHYILPAARRLLRPDGRGAIVSLIKPQYEAEPEQLVQGVLPEARHEALLESLRGMARVIGLALVGECRSPLLGHGGNTEYLWQLRAPASDVPA